MKKDIEGNDKNSLKVTATVTVGGSSKSTALKPTADLGKRVGGWQKVAPFFVRNYQQSSGAQEALHMKKLPVTAIPENEELKTIIEENLFIQHYLFMAFMFDFQANSCTLIRYSDDGRGGVNHIRSLASSCFEEAFEIKHPGEIYNCQLRGIKNELIPIFMSLYREGKLNPTFTRMSKPELEEELFPDDETSLYKYVGSDGTVENSFYEDLELYHFLLNNDISIGSIQVNTCKLSLNELERCGIAPFLKRAFKKDVYAFCDVDKNRCPEKFISLQADYYDI